MESSSSSADEVMSAPTEKADLHVCAPEFAIGEGDWTRCGVLEALARQAAKPRERNLERFSSRRCLDLRTLTSVRAGT